MTSKKTTKSDLEIQLWGWERASSMLREGMGLDPDRTDLRECLIAHLALKENVKTLVEALERIKNDRSSYWCHFAADVLAAVKGQP